jgi:tetratricopeptide (TPR) repeat protein
MHIGTNGWSEDAEQNRRIGIDYGRRALATAGEDPGALGNAATALATFGEDIGTMIGVLDRALALNPSFARGWYLSGGLKLFSGDPDGAIARLERSRSLSPRARIGAENSILGLAYLVKRQFDEAASTLLMAIQEMPAGPHAYRSLAACYAHLGRLAEAREIIERLRALTPAVMPGDLLWLRNPEHRELLLSGLRLAMGETAKS